MKRFLPLIIFLALAGIFYWRIVLIDHGDMPGNIPSVMINKPAPAFDLPNLYKGKPDFTSADLKGHVTLLNFFASWCSDCRAELKAFGQVSGGRHGNVRFLGIDTNDPAPATARALLAKAGIRYPVGVDRHAKVANSRYYIEGLPVTVFIDASGRIVGQAFGAQSESSLRHWVDELQRAASPGKAATS